MFFLSPPTQTHSHSSSLFPLQDTSKLSRLTLARAVSALTWSPHPAGPKALLSSALFLAPSPPPPLAARPAKARLFWKSAGRWQNVRSASSLQTGAPVPGQTAAVFACPQQLVFSFQARRSQGQSACGGQAGRQADVTTPRVRRREALTDQVMTGLPPAPPGPPTLRQGGQTEGSPRTCFSHLCCHTGHPTRRDGIHTLKNYYLVLARFWVEARGVHCCFLLTLEASD